MPSEDCLTPWDVQSKRIYAGGVAPTLNSGKGMHIQPIVMVEMDLYLMRERGGKPGGGKGPLIQKEVSGTLATNQDQTLFDGTSEDYVVRRLTPKECERLQGFPDDHTNIPWKGKPECPDGPRYKAIGNSMAVNCMMLIGLRLEEVDRLCTSDEGKA